MFHRLSEQCFQSFEAIEKWVKEWIESEDEAFYRCGVHLLPERWGRATANDGQYFVSDVSVISLFGIEVVEVLTQWSLGTCTCRSYQNDDSSTMSHLDKEA
ncbi:hypothetical protein ANCDUO_08618 [Ancylostoma duodenale]|uniref:Uncharacterized protein n=1 Tax=Ancylostoma duodenale TaxID=51022 RepID=A0A0C2CW23_9BILA|nr:hypothetical protein ANCDUO_08618 [Ancylostoma duodenale]